MLWWSPNPLAADAVFVAIAIKLSFPVGWSQARVGYAVLVSRQLCEAQSCAKYQNRNFELDAVYVDLQVLVAS